MLFFYRLLIAILLLSFGALLYFGYPIAKQRYFDGEKSEPESPVPVEQPQADNNSVIGENLIDEYLSGGEDEEQQTLEQKGAILRSITQDDCSTECQSFSGHELEYCIEVCGLKPQNENVTDCQDLLGIKKDYCLKDLGISRGDFSICKEIKDENVKSTCKNRLLEEEMDRSFREEDFPS